MCVAHAAWSALCMKEPLIHRCRECDRRIIVTLLWRCGEHCDARHWLCLTCALEHESHWLGAAEPCLWWRPERQGGRWWQVATFLTPDTDPDAAYAARFGSSHHACDPDAADQA